MVALVTALSDVAATQALLTGLATLALMAGGFTLIVAPLRRRAPRVLGLGVFLAGIAVFAPAAFFATGSFPGLLPNWLIFWGGVTGVGAVLLGMVRVGTTLMMPALTRFVLFPFAEANLIGVSGTVLDTAIAVAVAFMAAVAIRKMMRSALAAQR